MSKELAKTYDPKGMEDRIYQNWMDKGYFHAKVNPDKNHLPLSCRRQMLRDSCTWDMRWTTPCRIF